MAPSQAETIGSRPAPFHAARAISMKARPCVEVSSWRSREGTKAAASSAISRKPAWSGRDAARCACARNTPSQNPAPSASIDANQSRKLAASTISPASTAHSMPLEYENAPTGNAGDSHVISRYSAAASLSFNPTRSGAGCAGSSPARTVARRCGAAGGLFVVMSMGMTVMMVVVAMLVMVMVVAMIVRVIMRSVIVARMGVGVTRRVGIALGASVARRMRVPAAGIGAAFGIERRLDLDDARAQPFCHRLDDMIAPDPQAPRHNLRRQMAVAEMPGDANQMLRIVAANFGQRLGCRHHLDQPVVLEHQRIAAAQHHRVFEIEQKFEPARAG